MDAASGVVTNTKLTNSLQAVTNSADTFLNNEIVNVSLAGLSLPPMVGSACLV